MKTKTIVSTALMPSRAARVTVWFIQTREMNTISESSTIHTTIERPKRLFPSRRMTVRK